MGLDADFLELLTHTVTWKAYTGEDQWGNNTYGADASVKCYITEVNRDFAPNDTQSRQRVGPTTGWRLITDYYGIAVGDRMIIDGVNGTVTGAQTLKEEDQSNLFQQVDVETEQEV